METSLSHVESSPRLNKESDWPGILELHSVLMVGSLVYWKAKMEALEKK